MGHLPDFISDLALILITAGIATIVFKWLKQPVVLGYIVAGLLAGPYITWLPTVTDMGNVKVWSEIGVIFLLFALGLEFSFKKLMNVGGTASIATLINMGSMIIIGYIVGQLLDMSKLNSLFLGGMLSMSSTTIIIKAFSDMNLQKKKFAGIVFGMLIVEDLAAILMMVLLSTLAVSQTFKGEEMGFEILKLGFFILIWFVVGIYLIPTMLRKLKKYLNDETLLIFAVGMCLGMVLFASYIGFSAALGAFIMGSILAETIEAKHIEHLVEPLKNLFGAVFFVSVGMMIAPQVLWDYAGRIVLFTLIVLVGRVIFATLGVMASGQGLKVSIQAGLSLAQIGEFSFIIATLGMDKGVLDPDLYPIIVAVSVITTFTTPYFIKGADPFYNWLEKLIPPGKEKLLKGYAATSYKTVNKTNDWSVLLKSMLSLVAIYSCVAIAIVFVCEQFLTPFIIDNVPGIWGRILAASIALVFMAPFLRAILMKKNRSKEFRNLWNDDKKFNKGALISLIVVRAIICVVLVMMVLVPLFPRMTPLLIVVALIFITATIFIEGFKTQSRKIEARFMENFNSKQDMEDKSRAITTKVANDLLSKEIHIEEFEIPQSSPIIGKTLRELNFKQLTGVNIISIIRGSKKINIPDGNEVLYPFDRAIVAGSDEEIQKFTQSLEERKIHSSEDSGEIPQHYINLSQFVIEKDSPMIGKSIIDLNIRENTECMVIGIDRNGESIIDFKPTILFEEGDIVWLAGEKNKLLTFEENICEKAGACKI